MAAYNGPKLTIRGLLVNLDILQNSSWNIGRQEWYDLSKYGNTGYLLGTPTISNVTGDITFANATAQSVSVPGIYDTNEGADAGFLTNDFTVEVWIYPTSFNGTLHITSFPDSTTLDLRANSSGSLLVNASAFNTSADITGWNLTLNQWNCIAFRRTNGVFYAFKNGELVGTKTGFTNNFVGQDTLNIRDGGTGDYDPCKMRAVRVYDNALSDEELKSNYVAFRERIYNPVVALPLTTNLNNTFIEGIIGRTITATPISGVGGNGDYFYSFSSSTPPPSGLTINSRTGEITGIISSIGSNNYTIEVRDQLNQLASDSFTLSVSAEPLVVSTQIPNLSKPINSVFDDIPVAGSGGFGTLSYAISPALPTNPQPTETFVYDVTTNGTLEYLFSGPTSGPNINFSVVQGTTLEFNVVADDARPGGLYDFESFTFTTGNVTGPSGPSKQALISSYNTLADPWLNNAAFYDVSNGIQQWTVPATGTYTIEVAGSHSSSRRTAGRGAIIRGDFDLIEGEIINIVVGQPEAAQGPTPSGGGGGTYVVRSVSPLSSTTTGDILAIAGGGGGAHDTASQYNQATADANFGTSGFAGTPNGSAGGTNGNGGSYTSGGGSAGAGFLTDGNGRTQFPSSDGDLPKSYRNGSIGGGINGGSSNKGGFGGGGFTWYSTGWGGGGGGYSGGGTASNSNFNGNAGGGGSINNGTNTVNVGYNGAPGYVTITLPGGTSGLGEPVFQNFWIKTVREDGTGNAVTTGVTNNGTANGTVTWDTSSITPGTYYYISENSPDMSGIIFVQAVPASLAFNTSTGRITGIPNIPYGPEEHTVTVTDSLNPTNQVESAPFSLEVVTEPLGAVPSEPSIALDTNESINVQPVVRTGGFGGVTYSISPSLPAGFSFSTGTGFLTGSSASELAPTQFTITLTDITNASASASFTLSVVAAGAPLDFILEATETGRNPGAFTVTDVENSANAVTDFEFSGYYKITIPANAVYEITARGCSGAQDGVQNTTPVNYGAEIIAEVELTQGTELILLAGQTGGGVTSDSAGAGGGGGTFVATGSSVANAQPLIVAGGGGGSCFNRTGQDDARGYANLNQPGRAGQASGYAADPGWPVGEGGLASNNEFNIAAWNGGGFFTGGSGTSARSGGSHGQGFVEGALGGLNQSGAGQGGGFGGGGGGANNCGYGGGAGGYSGGGSGGYAAGCGGHGGGGGSYVDATASNVSTQNIDNDFGYIRIRSL